MEALDSLEEDLKAHGLTIKVENTLVDYLSCEIRFNDNKTRAWIGQPYQVKKLEKMFSETVTEKKTYCTPVQNRQT